MHTRFEYAQLIYSVNKFGFLPVIVYTKHYFGSAGGSEREEEEGLKCKDDPECKGFKAFAVVDDSKGNPVGKTGKPVPREGNPPIPPKPGNRRGGRNEALVEAAAAAAVANINCCNWGGNVDNVLNIILAGFVT